MAKTKNKPKHKPNYFTHPWFANTLGRWVIRQEYNALRSFLPDIIGDTGLQIGGDPQLIKLSCVRHSLQVGTSGADSDLYANGSSLPFADNSIDFILLVHALEQSTDARDLLREVVRVLRYEGHLVIVGFNPYSLLKLSFTTPWRKNWVAVPRLRDWLTLLEMSPQNSHYLVFLPPWRLLYRLSQLRWMEKAGRRWWPLAGGVFVLGNIKRKRGMRLIKPKFSEITSKKYAVAGSRKSAIKKQKP